MNTLPDEVLSPADRRALDVLQAADDQLTPAGCRKMLAWLAQKSLPAEGGDVALANDDGAVFAYVYSKQRPVYDLSDVLTDEGWAAFRRNVLDPKQHMSAEEVLALLGAEGDRRGSTR